MKKKLTILIINLFGLLSAAVSQPYYFKHYHVENGLSNNSVSCSLQDSKGFLWIGTINGLNRFDGYRFKIYRHDPEDSFSIGSSFIRSIFEDHLGNLWVGTNKSLSIFDRQSEKFTVVTKRNLIEVADIKEDKKGMLWIISDMNVFRYDLNTRQFHSYAIDSLPNIATSIAISEDSTIWISTNTGKIKKYLPKEDRFVTYSTLNKTENQNALVVQKIYPLSDGNLLVGTLTRGVKLFETHTKIFTDIVCLNKDKSDIYARNFMQMGENEYWIGTETGIYIYNTVGRNIVLIKKEYDDSYSLSDDVISTFCKDREGGLWIGTYFGGLNYYPKQFTTFQKYFPEYSKPSISGNAVHEITKDSFGNLWVGTEDGGLNKIDLNRKTYTTFKPTGQKTSIAYHNIHGLLVTGDSLWIGTFMHGLDIMNIRTGKVIRHYIAGPGLGDLKNNFIITIYRTREGKILLGTQTGLFQYNRKSDDFSPVPNFDTQVQAMLEDERGILWVVTRGNGVLFYNPTTNERGSLNYNPNDSNSLTSNYVNGIIEDSQNNLWFSTDAGLCKFQKEKNLYTRYTIKNGLPDNLIFRAEEDEKGNLFVSTSKGLVCLNPETGNIRTYTKSNGLLSDQFNYNSSFKDVDGRMYFGGVKGLISFKPKDFIINTGIPPVYITGIEINNQELEPNISGSPLSQSIMATKSVSLPYDQSTLDISFAALSYTVPEMNQYAYKMDGLDKDWTYLQNNRKAYYTKLPPGDYHFKVRGSNSSGIWNSKEASLEIIINPPWWQTVLAYLIYAAIFLCVSYLLIRSYLNRAMEKNKRRFELLEMEKEREIYHSKIEFFTNIAHEIRTPLTLIKMPLDKMMRKENTTAEITYNLKTMEKNTNRLIDLTDQLLDFRKTEMDKFNLNFVKTDITELLEETYRSFELAAEQKGLQFKLELPRISLQAFVDREALKKILSNLFNNAIKYAESKVIVQLQNFKSDDKVFTIQTFNDGYIIPSELKEKIFEPFYRIRETEKQQGTGIGLPLSRSLAELHKGVLDLSKSENGMNRFSLVLPIHQEKEFKLQPDDANFLAEDCLPKKENCGDSCKTEILLVEDNKEILDFIGNDLSSDYLVRKASNGQEAIEVLKEGIIQLVISDIMMPVMDGMELCKRIKTNIDYSHIPLILLTAKNSLHAKIEGLEVGADAYIEKPFSFEHLYAQISNLLMNRNKIKEHFANSPLTHIKSIGYTKADKIFLEKLKAVIDENLINMDIDVEQLAKIMNMSRPTFYRKIKALSNLTPHELIHIARLKKAAEYLSDGNYKVYEVAAMVGYTLQTNFARDFHKQFGMTPSDYMNNKQVEKIPSK